METVLLDANVLVRYLRADHKQYFEAAKRLMQSAESGSVKLVLLDAVVAETVYVLSSVYECSRIDIADALRVFINHGGVTCESEVLNDAFARYTNRKVDFLDCYLAAISASRKIPVSSFDRDFRKFKDIELRPPEAE